MVEVRSRAGQNIMIEANPRFWGPSQLFIDAGVNLFEAFLADNDFLSVPRPESSSSKETKYFWHGGMVDSLKQSGRLDYYGYTKEQLDKEFKDWLAADIYRRDDTIDLYKEEVE